MDINGISYYYHSIADDSNTFEIRFISSYYCYMDPQFAKDGIFYLDESNLYAYIQLQGCDKEALSASNASCFLYMDYFDKNACSQTRYFRIYLPSDFCPSNGETKYFTFKIPLPSDFYTLNPHKPLRIYARHLGLKPIYLYPPSKVSLPVPKEQYIPLTNIDLDPILSDL